MTLEVNLHRIFDHLIFPCKVIKFKLKDNTTYGFFNTAQFAPIFVENQLIYNNYNDCGFKSCYWLKILPCT